ncbi:MAG: PEP-CTERM sorting domain-containing protein [Planctomycetales bacterium]
MLKNLKLWGIVAAVALNLAFAGSASAGLAFEGTIAEWAAGSNPVVNGDKDFMYLDASAEMVAANPTVSIAQVGTQYTASFSFGVGGQDGPFSGWIQYSVTITDPNFVFNGVEVDSTHLGSGNSSVQKDIDWGVLGVDVSITSSNGSTDSTFATAGQVTLLVTDYVTIDGASNIASFVNTFTQTENVPEPATLAMLVGIGAMGLFRRNRRNGN